MFPRQFRKFVESDPDRKVVCALYRKCITRKTARQQRIFEETLLSAIQEQALSGITVSSLCDRAGMSRNIFYRLFDEKQDVLTALIDHTLTGYLAFSTDSSESGKERHMEVFFSFWQCQKPLLDGLRKSNRNRELLLVNRIPVPL